MKKFNLLLAFLAFSSFVAIAWLEVSTVWFAGDSMIGFLFVFTIPVAAISTLILLGVALYRNSLLIAGSTLIGFALAVSPLFLMPALTFQSWNHSLAKFDRINTEAVTQADLTEFDYASNHGFYSMKLKPLPEFEWYYDQHFAAPEGVFSAFSINEIPHVYVNKIRHGAKGVAYAPDKSMLPADGEFEYQHSGVGSWYIWSF